MGASVLLGALELLEAPHPGDAHLEAAYLGAAQLEAQPVGADDAAQGAAPAAAGYVAAGVEEHNVVEEPVALLVPPQLLPVVCGIDHPHHVSILRHGLPAAAVDQVEERSFCVGHGPKVYQPPLHHSLQRQGEQET